MIELSNYKKGWLVKNELYIRCQCCRQEMIVKRYYGTKNNLYLCIGCYKKLEKGGNYGLRQEIKKGH